MLKNSIKPFIFSDYVGSIGYNLMDYPRLSLDQSSMHEFEKVSTNSIQVNP